MQEPSPALQPLQMHFMSDSGSGLELSALSLSFRMGALLQCCRRGSEPDPAGNHALVLGGLVMDSSWSARWVGLGWVAWGWVGLNWVAVNTNSDPVGLKE